MDQYSKNVVDISIARIKNGEIDRQARYEKVKKYGVALVVMLLILGGVYTYDPEITKPLLNAQEPITEYLEDGDVLVSFSQDESGHYVFVGEINGKKVKFLLDTGATNVSVPVGVAKYLGLPFGQTYYSHTANGKSLSYRSKAEEVKVGEIVMLDVKASVASGMEGDEILLGMSFLKNLSVIQENGKIYLKQRRLISRP